MVQLVVWKWSGEFQRKQIAIYIQIDHAVGHLVVKQIEPIGLVPQFQAVHAGLTNSIAKKGMAVVIAADQQVDAGLAVLVAVPVVHPVVRHLQDPQLGNRAQLLDRLQRGLSGDPVAAQGCSQKTEMGQPKDICTGYHLPTMLHQYLGRLSQHRIARGGLRRCHSSAQIADPVHPGGLCPFVP